MRNTFRLMATTALTVFLSHYASATSLTGLTEYSANSQGGWYRVDTWNTYGPDGAANLYVSSTPHAAPDFLNGGNGAATSLNITLSQGRNDFYLFGIAGTPEPTYGLNIFLNGENHTTAISVFAPVRISSVTPAFSAAQGITPDLHYADVTATNTLQFTDGDNEITVVDYFWQLPSLLAIDRVSSDGTNPDGEWDSLGKVSLFVTPLHVPPPSRIPEPSTLTMLGFGMVVLLARRRGARSG